MARPREGQLDGFVGPAQAIRHAADPHAASAAQLDGLHLRGASLSGGVGVGGGGGGLEGRVGRSEWGGVGGKAWEGA